MARVEAIYMLIFSVDLFQELSQRQAELTQIPLKAMKLRKQVRQMK